MSHSVTITRTTTSSTNTSYIVLNTGYLKTFPGILKLFQLIIGIAIVTVLAINYGNWNSYRNQVDLFHYLMATTFTIGTFCLLLSCLISLSTGGIISKTIYELIYHSVAAILLLISSTLLLIEVKDRRNNAYMTAGILGLVNGVLYIISAFLAHRSYRGI